MQFQFCASPPTKAAAAVMTEVKGSHGGGHSGLWLSTVWAPPLSAVQAAVQAVPFSAEQYSLH